MSSKSLDEISAVMREIDIAMLSTHADNGAIAARPMSNNRDVDYAGTSFYFTWEQAHTVGEIERDPQVSLSFQDKGNFLIAVEGKAEIIRDKAAFEEHWNPDLDKWFENGIETAGIAMIKIVANRIHYWNGMEEGEIVLA
ncbi:MAG TPA: pyridoxamine 5'-phosphate oxidase family protein [Pseudorhizobium sp.]|nr:pyridoxamine 5'-phosphate oxidase family protein [Pseudorhizobium sp.]